MGQPPPLVRSLQRCLPALLARIVLPAPAPRLPRQAATGGRSAASPRRSSTTVWICASIAFAGCTAPTDDVAAFCDVAAQYQAAHDAWTGWATDPTGPAEAEAVARDFVGQTFAMAEAAPSGDSATWRELAILRERLVTEWEADGFSRDFWTDPRPGGEPRLSDGRTALEAMDDLVGSTNEACDSAVLSN